MRKLTAVLRQDGARLNSWGVVLISPITVFWEVDAQADFMLPDGKLYVPGAEEIIPNLNRLVETVRQGRVFLISSADAHNPDDLELRDWPPHCLKGTPGSALLPEACASRRLVIPNENGFVLSEKRHRLSAGHSSISADDGSGPFCRVGFSAPISAC